MALSSSDWIQALLQVVRLESEKIWLPVAEVRDCQGGQFELTYRPAFLRQGVYQGPREIRLDDAIVQGGVVEKGGSWSGIVVATFPDVGKLVVKLKAGRRPSVSDQVLIAPAAYLLGLLQWLQDEPLPQNLDASWLARSSRPDVAAPQVAPGTVKLRVAQAEAQRLSSAPLAVVWGPPGTGKTTTLAAMVASLVTAGRRVLVVAPTRIAADGACLAIDAALSRARLPRERGDVLRTDLPVYGESFSDQNPDLLIWADEDRAYQQKLPQLQRMNAELRAQILTANGIGQDEAIALAASVSDSIERLRVLWMKRQELLVAEARVVVSTVRQALNRIWPAEFESVFVDEASMVPVSDGTALLLQQGPRGSGSLVLFGDPMQLGPVPPRDKVSGDDVADAETAAPHVPPTVLREWFEQSVLRYLIQEQTALRLRIAFLNEQSRMCPELCQVVSDVSYQGRLLPADNAPQAGILPELATAISLLDPNSPPRFLMGMAPVAALLPPKFRNGSVHNAASATNTARLARYLAQRGHSVIACSPYRAQAGMLFRALGDLKNVASGTVHRVQGQEADVSIYDPAAPNSRFVKTQPTAGILLNVAASRARKAFVISADPGQLASNPLFDPFVRAASLLR